MSKDEPRDTEQPAPEETARSVGAQKTETDKGPAEPPSIQQNARLRTFARFLRRHGLSILLIAVYVTQAYYMKKQWDVMEAQLLTANKSADISREALVASERAWVLLDSVDLKRSVSLPGGKFSRYQVIFRNFGKGPATDVSICAEASTEPRPTPESYICDFHTEIVAAPGGLVEIAVSGPSFPETVKQLYIRGTVKYQDQFGIARHTEYCTSPLIRPNNAVSIGGCERNRAK
jgi:hypothetical protein